MDFIKKFTSYTTMITTCTLFACACVNSLFYAMNGTSFSNAVIPFNTLWYILLIGVICGFFTTILLKDETVSKKESIFRTILHYIVMNIIVMTGGYFLHWYSFTPSSIFIMLISIFIVYVLVCLMSYIRDKNLADKINERLEQLHKEP